MKKLYYFLLTILLSICFSDVFAALGDPKTINGKTYYEFTILTSGGKDRAIVYSTFADGGVYFYFEPVSPYTLQSLAELNAEDNFKIIFDGTKYVPADSPELGGQQSVPANNPVFMFNQIVAFSSLDFSLTGAEVFIANVNSIQMYTDLHIQLYDDEFDDISGKFDGPYSDPPSPSTPNVPIDGGLSLLLAAGLGYGVYAQRRRK